MKRQHKSVSELFGRRTRRFETRGERPQRRIPRVYQPRIATAELRSTLGPEALRTLKELAAEEMEVIRIVETTKFCGTCHRILPTIPMIGYSEGMFHKDNHEPDGWHWECKECITSRKTNRRKRILDLVWGRQA
jgi:hypothetical protein